ncbi:hypothetical protein D9M68_841500 [compost metagenome]
MPGHTVEPEGDPEQQEAINLSGALDAIGLVRREEQQARDHAHPTIPQARTEVMQAGGGHYPGEQGWQEKGNGRCDAEFAQGCDGPHEQRRLVRVNFGGAVGYQPVATLKHFQGYAEEALLVYVGWVT